MDLNGKKNLILNNIRLGLDFNTAALSISCTKEEIEQLEKDEEFESAIKINKALLEQDLIKDHNIVIEKCVENGVAAPIQWKLERVNPTKWGGKTKLEFDKPIQASITINKIRGNGDGN